MNYNCKQSGFQVYLNNAFLCSSELIFMSVTMARQYTYKNITNSKYNSILIIVNRIVEA